MNPRIQSLIASLQKDHHPIGIEKLRIALRTMDATEGEPMILLIDQDPYQATLLNMKFHPTALQSEEDLRKLSAMIKTYLKHGGKHVQFNVVSREMLLQAQQHPEQHRDLVVRVAGYSAYFTQLNRPMQDEVIARTELSLATM